MQLRSLTVLGLAAGLVGGVPAAAGSPGEDELVDGAVFGGSTSPHPGNVVANPAALLRLVPGVHFFVHGTARLDRHSIDRQRVDPDSGAALEGPRVTGSTLVGGGVAGVALAQPSRLVALSFAWRPDEASLDRDATAYHERGSRARRVDWLTLAGGFRVTDRIYLGLSGTLADREQRLAFARDTALEAGHDPVRGIGSDCGGAACGFEHPLAREEWVVDVEPETLFSTDNLVYTAGVVVAAGKDVWIAVATERPWQLGPLTMTGTATVRSAPRDGSVVRRGLAQLSVRLPVVWRLGVRARPWRGWDFVGELRLRRLSRTSPYDLHTLGGDLHQGDVPEWYPRPRGLTDSLAAWVGLEQVDHGGVARLGAWVGADTGAVPDDRLSAAAPWGSELAGALGLQLRLRPRWVLQLGGQVRLQPTTTTGSSAYDPRARVECVDSGYDRDLPACEVVREGYGLPTAAGAYGRWSVVGSLGLRIEVP